MSILVRLSAKHVVAGALTVSMLSVVAVSGISLVQASRAGAQMESNIAHAQAQLTKHEESLREAITLASGIEGLSLVETKRAAGIALRRGDADGGRLAIARLKQRHGSSRYEPGQSRLLARSVSPESAQAMTQAAAQYVAKATAYQTQLTVAKSAYALALDSGWSGMWLRMAGYPTISLSAPKTRLSLPAIDKAPQAATAEPASASPAAPLPPLQ